MKMASMQLTNDVSQTCIHAQHCHHISFVPVTRLGSSAYCV